MAAAALSSRGVVGVRTTKGLFFIVALLSLLCVASSWMDKDQLEKLKEDFQKAQAREDELKESYQLQMARASEFISEYLRLIKPLTELVKKYSDLSSGIPPMGGALDNMKSIAEKTKTYIDEQNVEIGAVIEQSEQKLGKLKKCIQFYEEQHAEL